MPTRYSEVDVLPPKFDTYNINRLASMFGSPACVGPVDGDLVPLVDCDGFLGPGEGDKQS